jgi:hypothetical protein
MMTQHQRQVLSVLLYSLCVAQSVAWLPVVSPSAQAVLRLSVLFAGDNVNKNDGNEEEVWQPDSTTDPCWQNLLDSDCNMSNMYASSFVVGKWIKSMPCGAGIEVGSTTSPFVSETIDGDVFLFVNMHGVIWHSINRKKTNATSKIMSPGLRYAPSTHDARCVPRIRSCWSGRHGLSPLEASTVPQKALKAGWSYRRFVPSFIHPILLPHRFRMSALHASLYGTLFIDGLSSLLFGLILAQDFTLSGKDKMLFSEPVFVWPLEKVGSCPWRLFPTDSRTHR